MAVLEKLNERGSEEEDNGTCLPLLSKLIFQVEVSKNNLYVEEIHFERKKFFLYYIYTIYSMYDRIHSFNVK